MLFRSENWLPGVNLSSGNLTFTVVLGEVLGNFEAVASDGGGGN